MAETHATNVGNWESMIWRVCVGFFWIFCMNLAHVCY